MKPEDIKRFKNIADKLQGKEEKGKYKFMALCPAHGDSKLSLWVELKESGKISLYCHAGCATSDICAAIGIKISNLYPIAQIVSIFDFIDLNGELIYQEVKYDTTALNRFRVRQPGKKKGEWIWDVKNIGLILYNLYDVVNSKKDDIIFMCEGCKDGRTVKHKGLIATAALWNNWEQTDTTPLDGKPVVILQDNDEGGKIKVLRAAHDRYGKSSSVKILLLPDLKPGGDVTDWLKAGNTIEKLLELAKSDDLSEWYPLASVRQQVNDGELTGLSFEYADPRVSWFSWSETYHPPEDGPLRFWDDIWMKGNPKTNLYVEISENELLKNMARFFALCYNKNAPKNKSDELYKPNLKLMKNVLDMGMLEEDLNVLKRPTLPIFNPFHCSEKIENYKPEDILLLKSGNFYVPERLPFPRNMDQCIAMHALPFDYDEKAVCSEINKAFCTQWENDKESIDMLLQFLGYYMGHSFKYKAILDMVGESNSGKTQILQLIRHFIGANNCEALSLSKIGNRFELYRARNAKLLISDDLNLTSRDLLDGSIVENTKSIPCGIPVRIERKNGEIFSRALACQMLIAGNKPPKIREFSNALSNRFYFLVFPHVFIRGNDMNPDILETWLPELPGLFNKALDAIPKLHEQGGFIEPQSSFAVRNEFEGGGNPAKKFIKERFDVNTIDDPVKWHTRILDLQEEYKKYCEDEGLDMLRLSDLYKGIETIAEIRRDKINVKVNDLKSGKNVWKSIKCWVGLRIKGTSGIITLENQVKSDEF